MSFRKQDSEHLEDFMKRTEKTISGCMQTHHILTWDVQARRNIFKWGGWRARLQQHDPNRMTLAVLLHKNWEWLRTIAEANGGRQLHGRYLKTWRWESLLYNYAAENMPGCRWFDIVQDPHRWNAIVQSGQ